MALFTEEHYVNYVYALRKSMSTATLDRRQSIFMIFMVLASVSVEYGEHWHTF